MVKVMRFSNTAMMVESAAKLMNTKNSVPHSCPNGIWSNTLGSVTNTSAGALVGRHGESEAGGEDDEAREDGHGGVQAADAQRPRP